MEKITIDNIEREISHLLEHGTMSMSDLEMLITLCRAMKYMAKIHSKFTMDDAKTWVDHLDPPARWTTDQTLAVMRQCGYDHDPAMFWAVMNSLFSDYGKTIIKYGVDRPDLWAAMTHDFICDADAVPEKVGRYWRDIVKH